MSAEIQALLQALDAFGEEIEGEALQRGPKRTPYWAAWQAIRRAQNALEQSMPPVEEKLCPHAQASAQTGEEFMCSCRSRDPTLNVLVRPTPSAEFIAIFDGPER